MSENHRHSRAASVAALSLVVSIAFAGEIRVPSSSIPVMEMSERKIIARRAALELKPNSVVNRLVPEGVAGVACAARGGQGAPTSRALPISICLSTTWPSLPT